MNLPSWVGKRYAEGFQRQREMMERKRGWKASLENVKRYSAYNREAYEYEKYLIRTGSED